MRSVATVSEHLTYLIANHDLGRWLPECLDSLLAQTDPRWRALVLDDASRDDSREVLARYRDPRIRVLTNARNLGYIASLRRLIAEAETDLVAILDADDAVTPDATALLLARYAEDPGAEFVYSRFARCGEQLAQRLAVHGSAIPPGGTALREGVVGAIRSFRRRAYARTAGLDDAMPYAEDRDLVYKLEEVTTPVFLDAALYLYRRRSDSQSHDPRKREIGAQSTLRARRAALSRRGARGARRLAYELHFLADYLAFSHRWPAPARAVARRCSRATNLLCRLTDAVHARGRARSSERLLSPS